MFWIIIALLMFIRYRSDTGLYVTYSLYPERNPNGINTNLTHIRLSYYCADIPVEVELD